MRLPLHLAIPALFALLLAAAPAAGAQADAAAALDSAIAAPHRADANRLRDVHRHPRETLLFFGVTPQMTVVEIWPGGGWYSEILGPLLRDQGRYYLAQYAVARPDAPGWQREARARQETTVAAQPGVYGRPVFTDFNPPEHQAIAPPGSADRVLTFRNVHNWASSKAEAAAFQAFYAALKPGGILGVVEHRARPGTPLEQMIRTGYMTEAYVIALAEQAGFRLEARAEINANPRDTTDHPNGVWTLPPISRGRLDPEKYQAIGESDRMTLRFRKPGPAP